MSTAVPSAPMPGRSGFRHNSNVLQFEPSPATPATKPIAERSASPGPRSARFVRRRGTVEQGRALEMLGHAVEYLVDSGMFDQSGSQTRDNQEAAQVLMKLSRSVFLECAEVVPLRQRMREWGLRVLRRSYS